MHDELFARHDMRPERVSEPFEKPHRPQLNALAGEPPSCFLPDFDNPVEIARLGLDDGKS